MLVLMVTVTVMMVVAWAVPVVLTLKAGAWVRTTASDGDDDDVKQGVGDGDGGLFSAPTIAGDVGLRQQCRSQQGRHCGLALPERHAQVRDLVEQSVADHDPAVRHLCVP